MHSFRFTCLMNQGRALNGAGREALFQAAKRLVREKSRQVRIKEGDCEGSVETDYQYVTLGSLSGIRFTGTLDAREGSSKTSFIVPERELDLPESDAEFFWMEVGSPAQESQKAWLN